MGKKRNQQTSYLRGLLIKKLVTRTGIENLPLIFLIFCKFKKMRKLRHFRASYKNLIILISPNF